MATAAQKYLTASEVLERWDHPVAEGTMNNWRSQGKGPPFVKFGVKVRYPIDQLVKWEEKNMHLIQAANDNKEPVSS